MSLDKELNKILPNNTFLFLYKVDNIIWGFYLIGQYTNAYDTFLDTVYGVHIKLWDRTKEWNPEGHYHLLLINLRAPLREDKYMIRDLVATIIHELIHAMGVKDEVVVEHLEKELIKGYKFKRIKIY